MGTGENGNEDEEKNNAEETVITVDLRGSLADNLEALSTVYQTSPDEIFVQALREHIDAMIERPRTLCLTSSRP